jgi:aspartate 1-decarboxylase
MPRFVSAKIHGIRVTGAAVEYNGSVSICPVLMAAADISPYEWVHIVNLTTGARWETYALVAERGEFTLNGGSARLGEIGDSCVVMTTDWADHFEGAMVIFCDNNNLIKQATRYASAHSD